jgi:hypothetical protein
MVQPTDEFIEALNAVPAVTALEQLIKARALAEAGATTAPRYPKGIDYVRLLEEVRDNHSPDADAIALIQAAIDAVAT